MKVLRLFRLLLLPAAWVYALVTAVRNAMYDAGLLASHTPAVPTICVGNVTVGGTGKTPHVEYLINLLRGVCAIGMVSRGYRRSTRGLVVADGQSRAREIGDEPFMILRNNPDVRVAVCADRLRAIDALMSPREAGVPGVVVLDDAFQHRRVRAGLNIVLVDSHRPVSGDYVLPAGMLRESRNALRRADMVVFTKCSPDMTRAEADALAARCLAPAGISRLRRHAAPLCGRENVFFTAMTYGAPYHLASGERTSLAALADGSKHIAVMAGIARPEPLFAEVERFGAINAKLVFPDHHAFTRSDIMIMECAAAVDGKSVIITTEKDAVRLLDRFDALSRRLRQSIYVQPIKVRVLFDGEKAFNEKITGYVQQNQGNR